MKRIILFCLAALVFFQATAFAGKYGRGMPEEEMFIGGVSVGQRMGYVESIYGTPQRKEWEEREIQGSIVKYVQYIYSPGFIVKGTGFLGEGNVQENEMGVMSVTLRDNSLTTPSGITVGMSYRDVANIFGEGSKYTHNNKTAYEYVVVGKNMTFAVDKDDVIVEITIHPRKGLRYNR